MIVTASLLAAPAVAADGAPWTPPAPQGSGGVPVVNKKIAVAKTKSDDAHTVRGPGSVTWPQADTAVAELASNTSSTTLTTAGSLPIKIGRSVSDVGGTAARVAGSDLGKVAVTVHDRASADRAGVSGLLMSLRRDDGNFATAAVNVNLDYSGFSNAYGGDWSSRLRLVAMPACVLSTPALAACHTATPIASRNNPASRTLTGDVTIAGATATVLAATAGPSGDNGDYTATSLSPAGTWQVGTQTGDFSWSLPLRVPPALNGPAPKLTIGYSSGSVDGLTGTDNTQGGWIGDGWESWPGFIERNYASCDDDNPDHKTGDRCWFTSNATLSMDGHAGELIQSGNVWRLKHDDGTKIEKLANASNGNGDQTRDSDGNIVAEGEYWKVTTTDGTQYYFGYHKLPGWTSGNAVTDSVFTAPVYGNNAGEPCHGSTYAASYCQQAWRWNLDYVVDPNGNSMAYFYKKETGAYGRNLDADQRTTYDRGGYLDHIDYGMRQNAEYSQAAPLRVAFSTAERCLSGCWTGTAWTSDPNKSAWPDTPWDQFCKAAPCTDQLSPTFWSARRLTKVTTQVRNGTSSYADVESWTLRQQFVNAGTGEGTPLWLAGVTHTGHVTTAGGTAVSEPEITFDHGSEPLPNRVDGPNDNRTALNRWRIKAINTESGGQINVTYSPISDCSRANAPNPETNTSRCRPAYYSPSGTPTLDWFHKYVVTQIDLDDIVSDQPTQTIFYDYLGGAAWHYNTDELTKDKYRTWGDWRGYGRVQIRKGDPLGQQTAEEHRYLRGMDGDHAPSSPGDVRDVWVSDTWSGTIEDHEALEGFERETITFDGPGGSEVSSTVTEPWKTGPTATRTHTIVGSTTTVTTQAWKTNTGTVRQRTALAAGGFRTTKNTTGYNTDGLPTTQDDFGDENLTGDETCTRTSYARNDTTWMINRVSQTETLSVSCANATTPAAPSTVLKRQRTFYDTYVDDNSFGAAPTGGNVVRTEDLDTWTGTTPNYVRTATNTYDPNGRVVDSTDPRGYITHTDLTTANGGLVTQVKLTNAKGHYTTTLKEPAWDLPTQTIDANNVVTDLAYDGLGRLTSVWLPGRAKATQTPSTRFTYQIRNVATTPAKPTAVTTETLLPTGTAYRKSITLYDGFLRQRQNQTQATGGGRTITETFYDKAGNTAWTSLPYHDTTNTAVQDVLGGPQGEIPSKTVHIYDGAGRETMTQQFASGVEDLTARTVTSYGGDRTHTTPAQGGTATTIITDVQGNTVELRQYHSVADLGSTDPATYDATRYTYDLLGQQTKIEDAAHNAWTTTYDLRGRATHTTDPDKGTVDNAYDDAGNIKTVTAPLGTGTATVAYTYDELGRKLTMRDDSTTGTIRAQWVYDTLAYGKGKLTSATRYVGTDAYITQTDTFDTYGRPTSQSVILPATQSGLCASTATNTCQYTTSTTYRANGQPFTTTLPAAADLTSEKLTYGYTDVGDEGTLLSAAQIYVYSLTYNKRGQLTQRVLGEYGSRVSVNYNYDEPTRRLTSSNVLPEVGSELANYSYTYDGAGNVTKITDAPGGQTADYQCYNYDYLRRVTSAWTPGGGDCTTAPNVGALGGPAKYWQDFTYDVTGNRKTETNYASTGNTTYTYNYPASGSNSVRPHTVTNIAATGAATWSRNYTYDNTGNTKTRPNSNGSTQTLTFDREGHLTSQVDGTATTSYIYDADGNRLIRTDATGKTAYLANGLEVRYTTSTSAKTATRYYTHHGDTIAIRTAAGVSWIISDHHGTAELTIKASDLTSAKRRSMPFGAPRGTTGTWAAGMDKGFVGGTNDPLGLTHLGAREYDPFTGRFISVDPKMDPNDPQSLHGYLYSNNNPATFTDPLGTDWFDGLVQGWLDVNQAPVEGFINLMNAEAKVQSDLVISVFDPNVSTKEAFNNYVDVQVGVAHAAVTAPITTAVEAWDESAATIEALSEGDMESAFHHGYVAAADTAYTAMYLVPGAGAARTGAAASEAGLEAAAYGARTVKAAEVGSSKATVTAGYNRFTGRVAAGCNSNPTGCAEADVERQIGFRGFFSFLNPVALRFTKAIRPRNGKEVPICTYCQAKYPPKMFPKDVKPQQGGSWKRNHPGDEW
ncbi:RHS repeat-associated core domain-containing protein [Hamadaea sp. NPDC051192]|uniref:RHS repeat domain-containing protein n=1 Tax=Hamadaea sp. NPDC051192 TaxID=3154940 RepID=UPI0034328CCF